MNDVLHYIFSHIPKEVEEMMKKESKPRLGLTIPKIKDPMYLNKQLIRKYK